MLSDRRQQILFSIINEYINNSAPVGSELVCEKYDIRASSATVRSEMAMLVEEGYLEQLHISGGRIPTSKAYRIFVNSIDIGNIKELELPDILTGFESFSREWLKCVSRYTRSLAINYQNSDLMKIGLDVLLEEPEFNNDFFSLQNLINRLEELDDYVSELVNIAPKKGIMVYIGEENPLGLNDCSMIISSYETRNNEEGLLALLGPTRMRYDKNMALVNYLVNLQCGTS